MAKNHRIVKPTSVRLDGALMRLLDASAKKFSEGNRSVEIRRRIRRDLERLPTG